MLGVYRKLDPGMQSSCTRKKVTEKTVLETHFSFGINDTFQNVLVLLFRSNLAAGPDENQRDLEFR